MMLQSDRLSSVASSGLGDNISRSVVCCRGDSSSASAHRSMRDGSSGLTHASSYARQIAIELRDRSNPAPKLAVTSWGADVRCWSRPAHPEGEVCLLEKSRNEQTRLRLPPLTHSGYPARRMFINRPTSSGPAFLRRGHWSLPRAQSHNSHFRQKGHAPSVSCSAANAIRPPRAGAGASIPSRRTRRIS